MTQPDLFGWQTQHAADLDQKRQCHAEAQAGIEASAEAAGAAWQQYALEFLREYLEQHDVFHTDDIWRAGLRAPTSSRGLGQVIRQAVVNGWIRTITTDAGYVAAKPSIRSHGALKPVWRSLIYRRRC